MPRNLALLLFSVFYFHTAIAQDWWNENFIIGTFKDPPITSRKETLNAYKLACDARFNLFTGERMAHTATPATAVLKDIREQFDVYFLSRTLEPLKVQGIDGVFFMDEPVCSQVPIIYDGLRKAQNNGLFFFTNLLPAYSSEFHNWTDYIDYLKVFADNGNGCSLPVLCFDNYYQDSYFDRPTALHQYFSNLAAIRTAAGSRPVWSTISVTEWMTTWNARRQQAYIRLGAFAPMAYGAKGLMYYCYDRIDGQAVMRDASYRDSCGWNGTIFYHVAEQNADHDIFFGLFNRSKDYAVRHADIAVRTGSARNILYFKYATRETSSLTRDWDLALVIPPSAINVRIFVADWNQDGFDDVILLCEDGTVWISTELKTWDIKLRLAGFTKSMFDEVHKGAIAVGNYNIHSGVDFCIAGKNNLRIYNDLRGHQFSSYEDYPFANIRQVLTVDSRLYVIAKSAGQDMLCQWENRKWSTQPIIPADLDTYGNLWIEQYADSTILCSSTPDGDIVSGRMDSNQPIRLSSKWEPNSTPIYTPLGIRNSKGGYDLYCLPNNKVIFDGILDGRQDTTIRYNMAKAVNQYIKLYMAPVIFDSEWVGCYHSNLVSPDSGDKYIATVDQSDLITELDSFLMVGVFKQEKGCYTLFIVNKSDRTLQTGSITLRGNYKGRARLLPRIDHTSDILDVNYQATKEVTTLSWNSMSGGEGIVLKLDCTP